MCKEFDTVLLTKKFYEDFVFCKQILVKTERVYLMAVVEIENIKFAIPLKNRCYGEFSLQTPNATRAQAGLAFTKAVVVSDDSYIDSIVRLYDKEQREFIQDSHHVIKTKMNKYVEKYKIKISQLNDRATVGVYNFCATSALQYFHQELGLNLNSNHIINNAGDILVQSGQIENKIEI